MEFLIEIKLCLDRVLSPLSSLCFPDLEHCAKAGCNPCKFEIQFLNVFSPFPPQKGLTDFAPIVARSSFNFEFIFRPVRTSS